MYTKLQPGSRWLRNREASKHKHTATHTNTKHHTITQSQTPNWHHYNKPTNTSHNNNNTNVARHQRITTQRVSRYLMCDTGLITVIHCGPASRAPTSSVEMDCKKGFLGVQGAGGLWKMLLNELWWVGQSCDFKRLDAGTRADAPMKRKRVS